MAKNGLNKELDFIVSVLNQWRTVPKKQRIEYLEKSLSVCVCAFFPSGFESEFGIWLYKFLVNVISKSLSVYLCTSVPFGFEGGIGIWLY